jgi:MFS transporter, DHA1 family, staphyloferrin A biosynthesis exporter
MGLCARPVLASKRVGIFRIVGPSLGGLFLLWIDVGGCLAFYRVALLVFGVELLPVRVPNTAPRPVGSNWLEDIKEGLTYIQAHFDVVEHACGVCPGYFRRNYQRFLPVFAKDILKVGPDGLGVLMAASGVGAVLSLVFLEAANRRWRPETLLWFSAKATPLLLILFCFSRSLWVSVVLLGLLGAMQILFRTVSRLVIQVEAPRELIGRVMSIFLMDQGLRSVGSMIMGSSVTIFGATLGLSLCSVISIALTAATFYRLLGNSSSRVQLGQRHRKFDPGGQD